MSRTCELLTSHYSFETHFSIFGFSSRIKRFFHSWMTTLAGTSVISAALTGYHIQPASVSLPHHSHGRTRSWWIIQAAHLICFSYCHFGITRRLKEVINGRLWINNWKINVLSLCPFEYLSPCPNINSLTPFPAAEELTAWQFLHFLFCACSTNWFVCLCVLAIDFQDE